MLLKPINSFVANTERAGISCKGNQAARWSFGCEMLVCCAEVAVKVTVNRPALLLSSGRGLIP